MKKKVIALLCSAVAASYCVLPASVSAAKATETISYTYDAGRWQTRAREMEKLDRGLVAVKTDGGVFLSWRLFDSEDTHFGSSASNVSFNIYRDNIKIETVTNATNYTDTTVGTSYSVAPVENGREGEKCAAVSVMNNNYFDISLDKPQKATLADGQSYNYTVNDCSTGDLDGDGEYEIVVKWDCNSQDNSKSGYTGNVFLDAYKLDGTKLWRVDLGPNVRAGSHYTQFLVYDFDGDGRAEMTCQTAPGSKDSTGSYVTGASHVEAINGISDADNQISYINEGGYNLTSDEFLTVFESDGTAADTIYYPNQRINANVWGDGYGNRCDRFTATVAYMDGVKPYAFYMRGYYFGQAGSQRQAACAVSYDGTTLECAANHSFDTYNPESFGYKSYSSSYDADGNYKGVSGYSSSNEKFVGNGNHNCSTADTDNDGKDEVMTGALCYEFKDDNTLGVKWCTFLEHGDALHIGDYDPTHEGFEFFTVHEDGDKGNADGDYGYTNAQGVRCSFGMSVIDPGVDSVSPKDDSYNNLIMFHEGANDDTGRGVMANIGMGGYYQIWSSKNNLYIANGGRDYSSGSKNGLSQNFRIFWDGDLYDELLDGTTVTSYNADSSNWWSPMDTVFTAEGCTQINGTKANPALQADLFGDWREELVYPTTDNSKLRVFTTTTPTEYKIKTLMQDPVYRVGVSAEQTAYNQPPHVGLYLSDELFGSPVTSIEITKMPNKTSYAIGDELDTTGLEITATRENGETFKADTASVTGFDSSTSGTKTLTVTYEGKTTSFNVEVKTVASIYVIAPANTLVYQGSSLDTTGLKVMVTYSDGTTGQAQNYTIGDFDNQTLGEKRVTISYGGKSSYFTVTVMEASLSALNRTYETDNTESILTSLQIGTLAGDFTIEHKVKINSMPANGTTNKKDTSGFYMRFMNPDLNLIGGGWYLTDDNGQAKVVWKHSQTKDIGTINIGREYTFRYDFTNVANGAGAYVTLTILDSDGNQVCKGENLSMRNFTDTASGVEAPITVAQVFNQAVEGREASVTFSNAKTVVAGDITDVTGNSVSVNVGSTGNIKTYAVKYNEDGTVDKTAVFTPETKGDNTFNLDFNPDKVFLWNGMKPMDMWTKAAQ